MRTVVIVLLDPAGDAVPGLLETVVFVEPHLFFFQAAMEPFDVAVAVGMVVSRASMRDTQPVQGFHIACRSKLRAIVGGQRQTPFHENRKAEPPAQRGSALSGLLRCGSVNSGPSRRSRGCSNRSPRYAQPTLGPAQTLVMPDCQT
jgi:hypothetical protein